MSTSLAKVPDRAPLALPVEPPGPVVTPKETVALDRWKNSGRADRLSPTKEMEFYNLFLHGTSCEDIVAMNPGFDLGLLVQTRLEDNWDRMVWEYRQSLLATIKDAAIQLECEAIIFTADQLRTAHKLYGQKLKRFLQTGDRDELNGLEESFLVKSQKQYRDTVDLLLRLTGQSREANVHHEHRVQGEGLLPPGPVTAEVAEIILKALEQAKGAS